VTASSHLFLADIREQPAAFLRLLHSDQAAAAAEIFVTSRPPLVRLAAHGSSLNAAVYASYLISTQLGLRSAPTDLSAVLADRSREPFDGDIVLAFSQSGETADVVSYVELARRRGARAIAVTNEGDSALAQAADVPVTLLAGRERAIPATKTYTTQLLAAAMIVQNVSRSREIAGGMARLPELADSIVDTAGDAARGAAEAMSTVRRIVVVGDGFEHATAREIALKLTEAAGIPATHLRSLEALHGHFATLRHDVTVVLVASPGPLLGDLQIACDAARRYGSQILAIGSACEEVDADLRLAVPIVHETLSPLLTVIAGQLLTCQLARLRDSDAARPPGLQKLVTARPSYLEPELAPIAPRHVA
jgi:glucosamine--fructose-6-phosphate aminotransferase (isomerizing)